MASINLDLDYFSHPKTRRLIGLLGRGAEVIPLRVWCFCGRHYSESGRLAAIGAQEIEAEVLWWGKPGEAVEALVRCGFLEIDGDTFIVHDWLSHSGHIAVYKKRAEKAAKARWAKADEEEGCLKDASSNASSNATLSNGLRIVVSSEEEKPKTSAQKCAQEFEEFWNIYPSTRKHGKGDARKAWARAVKKVSAYSLILAATEYAASPVGRGQYAKGPAPWLNQECWDDDRAAWNRSDGKGGSVDLSGIMQWAAEGQE